jgi:hypothetical protein
MREEMQLNNPAAYRIDTEVVSVRDSKNFFIPPLPNITGNSSSVIALTTRLASFIRTIPFRRASEKSAHWSLRWSVTSH